MTSSPTSCSTAAAPAAPPSSHHDPPSMNHRARVYIGSNFVEPFPSQRELGQDGGQEEVTTRGKCAPEPAGERPHLAQEADQQAERQKRVRQGTYR